MTEPKDSESLDPAAIDDGWGEEPEAPPVPAPKPGALRPARPAPSPVPAPVPPPAAERPALPPDDEIDFEADGVARDSMPTFQHPNPLEFDRDVDSQGRPRPKVPKPPPLPKFRKR